MNPDMNKYEAVIGLEIHIQLNAATKLFCDCPNQPGDSANSNICPVCLWLPGALPRLSAQAVEKAVLSCLAGNCTICEYSAFDQKVYYYPDLPKGYQLSQHHKPLAKNGWIDIVGENGRMRRLRIHHIHMEEDVARLVHETEGNKAVSLVDFNRAGAPLIEIVTEPDIRSPFEAMEFLKTLRTRLRYTGCTECSMEQGTMRADANISLRPAGTDEFNTKVEVKNMNSIHHVGDAIAYEIQRQTGCMERNETVTLHTRLWDPDKKITVRMREKFAGPCVPDPCVPSIHMDALWLEKIKKRLPEMPDAKASRFVEDLKLPASEAFAMSQDIEKDSDPERIISEAGLEQVSDTDSLEAVVDEILAAHPDDVSDYKNGNPKVIGFFMGLAMKASKGKANPKRLKEILSSRLDSR